MSNSPVDSIGDARRRMSPSGSLPDVRVNIRAIAFGGQGVGEVIWQSDGANDLLGITAFVPLTATGEEVVARVVQRKHRHVLTALIAVEKASPDRTEPLCQYYGICGGCQLQHLSYEAELRAKRDMILGAMNAGGLSEKVMATFQNIHSGQPYRYRRRVTLHVDAQGTVGFYKHDSRIVVPVTSCSVAVELINAQLKNIQQLGRDLVGIVSSVVLEADDQGVVAILKITSSRRGNQLNQVVEIGKKYFPNLIVWVNAEEIAGSGRSLLSLDLGKHRSLLLRAPAGHFSQVNWPVNKALVGAVIAESEDLRGCNVLDLYSGAGNFSLPLAMSGFTVLAIESNPKSVSIGTQASVSYRLQSRLSFIESSVEKYLAKRDKTFEPRLVIADPPRSGLGSVAGKLNFKGRLLLVSCSLPSFVRDIKALGDHGWVVKKIEAFDMFSRTTYVEVMTVLDRE